MSEESYASISIPSKYLTGEVISLIEKYTDRRDRSADPVVQYESHYASDGRFDDLENELIDMGIPFDRYTGQDFNTDAETRYYRPARDDEPEIDITTTENRGGEMVPASELKEILVLSPEGLAIALRAILKKYAPDVSSLINWNK